MFSGIVEGTATLLSSTLHEGIIQFTLEMPFDPTDVKVGDSICVSGVCLTATNIAGKILTFELMPETIKRTSLGNVRAGGKLNVERSLQVGGRVHGHFVFGHIDGVTTLTSRTEQGGAVEFVFSIPEGLRKYFAHKGSVSINGVSLTLGEITKDSFKVYLIPHTLATTTLGQLQVEDVVNIEVDMLARYAFGEA